MSTFKEYAGVYDLLYLDKPYAAEAEYVIDLMFGEPSCNFEGRSVIEIGCGTGRHAELLAEKGLRVKGYDISTQMIELARGRVRLSGEAVQDRVSFHAEHFRGSSEKVDAVYSLFHVVSYHVTDEQLNQLFSDVSESLVDGGTFIFDYWYGPAVCEIGPSIRCVERRSENSSIFRVSRPNHRKEKNIVDVEFDVFFATPERKETYSRLQEVHSMRYFTTNELSKIAKKYGLMQLVSEEWMTGKKLGKDTWSAVMVLKKK